MNRHDIRDDYSRLCMDLRHANQRAEAHQLRITFAQHQVYIRPDGFVQLFGEPYLRSPSIGETECLADVAARHDAEAVYGSKIHRHPADVLPSPESGNGHPGADEPDPGTEPPAAA